jgi:hypothetical protein
MYQQQLRYIQNKGLNTTPLELSDKDLTNQITKWQEGGDHIILLMDVNEHPTEGKFSKRLSATNPDIYKILHKSWGPEAPYTHINGSQPIDGGDKSPEIEVVNLAMLNFRDSPGDHRLLIFNMSTKSLLGEFRHKVCRLVSRCLVTSQLKLVEKYNKTIRKQFEIHRIEARLDAVDKMSRYYEYPAYIWLRAMIIKLYKQMTKIRQDAEKKCRKILQQDSNFSPTIQMWYDQIHAYLQLIRLKEGKAHNVGNIMRFAKRKHIENPKALLLKELKDGIQFARIRKSELQKQARGLRKVHLRDRLIDVQEKHNNNRANKIKQKIH